MKIVFYGKKRRPVVDFIDKLPSKDQARIVACLKSIEELGFDCPRVEFRQITGKLWEIKISTAGSRYRIFYVTIKRKLLVLLHAYKKQSQKAPKKELAIAEKRLMEVLNDESFYLR
jgi:phage-related protein